MSRKRKSVKVWRCGNFVIRKREVPTLGEEDWRLTNEQVRDRVCKGVIGTVEAIEVSSLDGAWCVRVMPNSQMETILNAMLDENESDVDNEWMRLVCTNLMTVSSVPNGHYHTALMMLTAAYSDPSLISGSPFGKKRRAFAHDVRKVRDAFLAWRKEYDELVLSQDDGLDHDINAERAAEILDSKKP